MKDDNMFNVKYQKEMQALEVVAERKGRLSAEEDYERRKSQEMFKMVVKKTLPCGHIFYYPSVMLIEKKLVYYPVQCLTCQTYYILEVTKDDILEKDSGKDMQTIKDIYDLIGLPGRYSMSGAVYKAIVS